MLTRIIRKLKNLKKQIIRRHTEGQEENNEDRKKYFEK
jgi:hypothetical protein